jgi:multidrug resistance efflux pump
MSSLPPIPHSASQRWREFRFKGVPLLLFAAALVTVVVLWRTAWTPTAFVGEVQSTEATVRSEKPGLLLDLTIDDLQTVTNRQVLGRVQMNSPEAAAAQIAAMKTDLQVMRVRMTQDQHRNDLGYQEARLDLQLRKLELASAQIRLQQAEGEFTRMSELHKDRYVPAGATQLRNEFGFDVAVRDRDLLRKEVEDKAQAVTELERGLEQLRPQGALGNNPAVNDAIDAAIAAQEKLFKETVGSVTLRAPIAGMVKRVYRHSGENVIAGEPLVEIGSDKPERILGFVRQPIVFRPQVGDPVEVRKRGNKRQVGLATVIRVGTQLQLFTQPLRVRGFDASMERGLPVLLTVPENLELNPGETVDLVPQRSR